MNRDEKIYLIYCLLKDVRHNWAYKSEVTARVELAKELCIELGGEFLVLAHECERFGENGYDADIIDGRFFRDEFPYGYENMEKLHECSRCLEDKSDTFRNYVLDYITFPQYLFDDVAPSIIHEDK